MNDTLARTLRQLRLSGLLASLEVRLHKAHSHALNHREFLELILQDELAVRADRQIQRRLKAAGFSEHKPLEDFDWTFKFLAQEEADLRSGQRPLRPVTFFYTGPSTGRKVSLQKSWQSITIDLSR